MSTLISERMRERGFKDDAALAVAVRCDRSMISRIRHGKVTPSLPLAVRLSDALDLPASTFVVEKNEPSAESDAA